MTCDKVFHPDKKSAEKHLRWITRGGKSHDGLHAYRCSRCGGWHVGHGNKAQKLRKLEVAK